MFVLTPLYARSWFSYGDEPYDRGLLLASLTVGGDKLTRGTSGANLPPSEVIMSRACYAF
jgi:hypothetical protein